MGLRGPKLIHIGVILPHLLILRVTVSSEHSVQAITHTSSLNIMDFRDNI